MESETQKEYTSKDCYKKADVWQRRKADHMMEEEKTSIIDLFRDTSLLNDVPIWIIGIRRNLRVRALLDLFLGLFIA